MTFKKLIIFLILTTLFYQSKSQTISLNEFDRGEFLAVNANYAVLRIGPDTSAAIIDTIYDNYHGLLFLVLRENSTNDFVKVKIISSKWSNGLPDSATEIYTFPKLVDDGKEGWILKKELLKHPVPDGFLLNEYQNNEEILFAIIENSVWYSLNNKVDYELIRNVHADCFYRLGKKYYEQDSLKKAIFYMTKSIQVLPKTTAYIIRALAKANLEDYQGAISDCNKILQLKKIPIKPNNIFDEAYLSSVDFKYDLIDFIGIRGFCYLQLKNYNLAIIDFDNSIKSDNTVGKLYYYRGIAKYNIGQKTSGCLDFSKAGELGFDAAYEVIQSHCK